MTPLQLTFHIATCARPQLLERCLRSVLSDLPENGRVQLFVSSTDRESHAVASNFAAADDRLTWRAVPGEHRAAIRNRAFAQRSADLIAFIDDDCEIPAGYCAKVISAFSDDPTLAILGGPNLTPPGSSWQQKLTGAVLSIPFCAPMINARYAPRHPRNVGAASELDLILCNLVVRRDSMRGEFNATLPSNEENLFLYDQAKCGAKIRYLSDLTVWHHRRDSLGKFLAQVRSYGRGRAAQTALAPKSLHPAFLAPSIAVVFTLLCFVGAIPLSIWAFLLILHQAIALASAATQRGLRVLGPTAVALAPMLTLTVHASYGIGFLGELLGGMLRNGRKDHAPNVDDALAARRAH